MAKKKKKIVKTPIKNANLIGKGGGQVKKIEGSWTKGVKNARTRPTPSPSIKKHISTTPAKSAPPSVPGKGRTLSSAKKSLPAKPAAQKKVATSKPLPTVNKKSPPKVKPKTKVPSKTAMASLVKQVKKAPPVKKVAPIKVKKGPTKSR